MASRVKGITVEIGGNTTKLNKALEGTNKHIGATQRTLKDVERLLKLDPTNTELLSQKQRLLADAVSETKGKLDTLKKASKQAADTRKDYDAWKAAYDPIQDEIMATSQHLKDLREQQKELAELGDIDSDAYQKLGAEIEETTGKLSKLRSQAKEVSKQFGNPISAEQYDSLQREIVETEQNLKNLEKQVKDFGSVAAQKAEHVAKKFGEASEKIADTGEKITKAGEKMMPVTGAVIAGGTAVVATAASLDSAANSFMRTTGTAADGLETLADGTQVAIDNTEKFKSIIEDIYENNYGESFDDIAAAMADVKNILSELDDSQLQNVTESALTLRDTFGMDVPESLLAANSLMDQFSMTAEEAFSLIVQGAQAGLNQNGDLLDVINEYAVQFKNIGYSAEDMFNMLVNGAEQGTWSIDKMGDAVKEFNIRMSDGSAKEAVEALGFSWEMVSEAWSKGGDEARETLNMLLNEFEGLERTTEGYNIGVGLLGTMFEDLGYDAVLALSNTAGEISATNDAMNALKEQRLEDLSAQFSQLGRTAVSDIAVPLGEYLIPMISEVISKVSVWLDRFGELSPAGQKIVVILAALVAGIGPALIGIGSITTGISQVTSATGKVIEFLPKMKTAFSSVFGFIAANPVVLLIAAIVGLVALIATKGDEIQAYLDRLDKWLQGVFAKDWTQVFGPILGGILNKFFASAKEIWDSLKQVLNGLIDFIRGVFTGNWQRAWSGVVSVFSGIFSSLKAVAKTPINAVISLVNKAIGGINGMISLLNKVPGVNIGSIPKIPMLWKGGTLYSGDAIVGERGPELLTVSGGKAVVRPLNNHQTTNHTTNMGGTTINVYAHDGQDPRDIAREVMELIQDDIDRKGAAVGA